MRKQDIEIVINPKGEVTFEVKGVKDLRFRLLCVGEPG
jgi:hypothetical protein